MYNPKLPYDVTKIQEEATKLIKISQFKTVRGTHPPRVKFLEINAMNVLLELTCGRKVVPLNFEIELMDYREWRNWKHYSSPESNIACLRNLNPNTSYIMRVRVFVSDSVSNWSKIYDFRTTELIKIFEFPRNMTYCKAAAKCLKFLKNLEFKKDVYHEIVESANILIFGDRGAGKSSLINGWQSGLHQKYFEIQKTGS